MRTMSATTDTGADAQNDSDELPANWTETRHNHFERADGAELQVRTDFPTRSAGACNAATHTDATGTPEVLFYPVEESGYELVHRGGTEADAREAALAFIREEGR